MNNLAGMTDVIRSAVDCGCCPIDEPMVQEAAEFLLTMYPDRMPDSLADEGAGLYYFGITLQKKATRGERGEHGRVELPLRAPSSGPPRG